MAINITARAIHNYMVHTNGNGFSLIKSDKVLVDLASVMACMSLVMPGQEMEASASADTC